METAARSNTAHLQLNPQVILTWLRTQLAEVQAQWHTLPATLQTVLGQARTQLRTALDVPSREELQALTARLGELDARLATLTASQRPVEVLASGPSEEPAAPSAASAKSTKSGDEKRQRKQ